MQNIRVQNIRVQNIIVNEFVIKSASHVTAQQQKASFLLDHNQPSSTYDTFSCQAKPAIRTIKIQFCDFSLHDFFVYLWACCCRKSNLQLASQELLLMHTQWHPHFICTNNADNQTTHRMKILHGSINTEIHTHIHIIWMVQEK